MNKGALNNQIINQNPLGGIFKLILHRNSSVEFFCNKFYTPTISISSTTQKSPFMDISLVGLELSKGNFKVEFKVDEDMQNYIYLYNWMRHISHSVDTESTKKEWFSESELTKKGPNFYTDISITTLTNKFNTNHNWKFQDCFPIELSGLSFDVTQTEFYEQIATCTFEYTVFDISRLSDNSTQPPLTFK